MNKEAYRQANEAFLAQLAADHEVRTLQGGIMYKVIAQGEGQQTPALHNVVTVHYRGTLVNGREFDSSFARSCPEAFRLRDVIEGWQIALSHMHVGDYWTIYIPADKGYGRRASGPIPGNSTLIFEVQLLGIA